MCAQTDYRDEVVAAVVELFTELALQASVTGRVGWLPDSSRDLLVGRRVLFGGAFGPGALCSPAPDGGWICPRFAELHKHLAPGYQSGADKGRTLSHYSKRMRRRANAEQLSLLIAGEKLVGATPEESQRVTALIYQLDCALDRKQRRVTDADYPGDLVRDALTAVRRWPNAQLDIIAEAIAGLMGHPALPNTAETLLPRLEKIIETPEVKAEIARLATRRKR